MEIDKNTLKDASLMFADIILANSGHSISTEKDALSEDIYNQAMGFCNILISNNCDPNVVPRAMKYLAAKHPFTLDKDSGKHWPHMLEVLLEIVCSRVESTDDVKLFLDDLEKSITKE